MFAICDPGQDENPFKEDPFEDNPHEDEDDEDWFGDQGWFVG